MKAAVYHGRQDLRVEEIVEPEPGTGHVKLKVFANGICGTDLHEYFDGPLLLPQEPHPLTGQAIPVVLGHEFAGEVVQLGAGVHGYEVGDAVAVEPIISCESCLPCLRGAYNLCQRISFYGLGGPGGGLAQFVSVAQQRLHKLPSGVSLLQGALAEPMAVAWHAVGLASPARGDKALVMGAGPIGLGTYFALRAAGVEDVLVVQRSAARRATARRLGATVLDPADGAPEDQVMERFDGPADLVFDCAGSDQSFKSACAAGGPQSRVTIVASCWHELRFDPIKVLLKEQVITASCCYRAEDYRAVLGLMAEGHFPASGWVSEIPLDDVVDVGLLTLQRGEATKILVRPN